MCVARVSNDPIKLSTSYSVKGETGSSQPSFSAPYERIAEVPNSLKTTPYLGSAYKGLVALSYWGWSYFQMAIG